MKKVLVCKETAAAETRVAVIPDDIKKKVDEYLMKKGI